MNTEADAILVQTIADHILKHQEKWEINHINHKKQLLHGQIGNNEFYVEEKSTTAVVHAKCPDNEIILYSVTNNLKALISIRKAYDVLQQAKLKEMKRRTSEEHKKKLKSVIDIVNADL